MSFVYWEPKSIMIILSVSNLTPCPLPEGEGLILQASMRPTQAYVCSSIIVLRNFTQSFACNPEASAFVADVSPPSSNLHRISVLFFEKQNGAGAAYQDSAV